MNTALEIFLPVPPLGQISWMGFTSTLKLKSKNMKKLLLKWRFPALQRLNALLPFLYLAHLLSLKPQLVGVSLVSSLSMQNWWSCIVRDDMTYLTCTRELKRRGCGDKSHGKRSLWEQGRSRCVIYWYPRQTQSFNPCGTQWASLQGYFYQFPGAQL